MNGSRLLHLRRLIAAALVLAMFMVSSPVSAGAGSFTEDDFEDLKISLDCFLDFFTPEYQDVMRVWPMLEADVLATFVEDYIYHRKFESTINDNYFWFSKDEIDRVLTNVFGVVDAGELDYYGHSLVLSEGYYGVPAASGDGGFYELRLYGIDNSNPRSPRVTAERYYVSDFEDDRYIGRFNFGFSEDPACDSGYHLGDMYIEDLAA